MTLVCWAANGSAFVQTLDLVIPAPVQKLAACLAYISTNFGDDRYNDSRPPVFRPYV